MNTIKDIQNKIKSELGQTDVYSQILNMNYGKERRELILQFLKDPCRVHFSDKILVKSILYGLPVNSKYQIQTRHDKDIKKLIKSGLVVLHRVHYGICDAKSYIVLKKDS